MTSKTVGEQLADAGLTTIADQEGNTRLAEIDATTPPATSAPADPVVYRAGNVQLTAAEVQAILANHIAGMPTRSEISVGLLQAQRAVTKVTKSGEHAKHGYKFTTVEDMIEGARGHLLDAGLTLALSDGEPWTVDHAGRTPWLISNWVLEHPESGERRTYKLRMPVGNNDPDKALSGALSYTLKDLLRTLLLIPREDPNDPDQDGRRSTPRFQNEPPRTTERRTVPNNPPPQSRPAPQSQHPPASQPQRQAASVPTGAPSSELKATVRKAWQGLADKANALGVAAPTWRDVVEPALGEFRNNHSAADLQKILGVIQRWQGLADKANALGVAAPDATGLSEADEALAKRIESARQYLGDEAVDKALAGKQTHTDIAAALAAIGG